MLGDYTLQVQHSSPMRKWDNGICLVRDEEKADVPMQITPLPRDEYPIGTLQPPSPRSTVSLDDDHQPSGEERYERELGLMLLHLALASPLLTVLLSVYSITATIFVLFISPISLCLSCSPLGSRLTAVLAPVIHFQLRLIYATRSNSHAPATHHHQSKTDPWSPHSQSTLRSRTEAHHASLPRLLLVPFFGPIPAIGIAVAAWVAAVFWLYAAILGEPNQKGGREEEGRAAVRAIRGWWEYWLRWGIGE